MNGNVYITRTSVLKLYSPQHYTFKANRHTVTHDMEVEISTPTPLHVSLDARLNHLGLRLVYPTYLPVGRHVLKILVDVMGADVVIGRGSCLLHLDTRGPRQRFSINAEGLYKDSER